MLLAGGRSVNHLCVATAQVPRAAVPIMRDRRTNIFSISDVEDLGPEKVVEMALDRAWDGCDAVYLSFDIDVIEVRGHAPSATWRPQAAQKPPPFISTLIRVHPRANPAQAGFVPGTGWPEPGGLLPREALKMVGLVAAEGLCGMEVGYSRLRVGSGSPDHAHPRPSSLSTVHLPACPIQVVEVSPPYDCSDITALMGLRISVDVLGSMVAHGKLGKHKSIIDKPFVPF